MKVFKSLRLFCVKHKKYMYAPIVAVVFMIGIVLILGARGQFVDCKVVNKQIEQHLSKNQPGKSAESFKANASYCGEGSANTNMQKYLFYGLGVVAYYRTNNFPETEKNYKILTKIDKSLAAAEKKNQKYISLSYRTDLTYRLIQ